MSNHSNNVNLIIEIADKGMINATCLQSILETDLDFSENIERFRPYTLKKKFKNEAERVAKEIFAKRKKVEDEYERLNLMVADLFSVKNFIGQSDCYGSYTYEITETDFSFIISIAFVN